MPQRLQRSGNDLARAHSAKVRQIMSLRPNHAKRVRKQSFIKNELGSSPISRVLSRRLAPTGQSFLWSLRYRKALAAYPGALRATSTPPYLALPRMGFTKPVLSPVLRWALTRSCLRSNPEQAPAPFQPYLISLRSHRRYIFCCTFRRLGSFDL